MSHNCSIASYSGGKDSALAVYRAVKLDRKPIGLLTTVDPRNGSSWFHQVPEPLLKQAADSMGMKLMTVHTGADTYTADFEKALSEYKSIGAESCIFGDIDIEEHFLWCDERCKNTGIKSFFPLWGESREALVHEFIDSGFKAVITVVDVSRMDIKYLGEALTKELVQKISADGVDICGESGEFHTFVFDGPLFRLPVRFSAGRVEQTGNYARIPIKTA